MNPTITLLHDSNWKEEDRQGKCSMCIFSRNLHSPFVFVCVCVGGGSTHLNKNMKLNSY